MPNNQIQMHQFSIFNNSNQYEILKHIYNEKQFNKENDKEKLLSNKNFKRNQNIGGIKTNEKDYFFKMLFYNVWNFDSYIPWQSRKYLIAKVVMLILL